MEKYDGIKPEQRCQEEEYWFPYHYIAQYSDNKFKHFFLDTWSINYASTLEFLLDKTATEFSANLVDIGCGDGRFARELALTNQNCTITGIDYSEKAIGLAIAMNPVITNLTFKVLDITRDSQLARFDTAILMEVLEHIPLLEVENFMLGVRGLLKHGGILHLTVPHINMPLDDMHFQHFSAERLLAHLKDDFEVIEIVPFEKSTILRRIMSWFLSNRYFILSNTRCLSFVYRYYKKNLFFSRSEKDCQRIYIKARAK